MVDSSMIDVSPIETLFDESLISNIKKRHPEDHVDILCNHARDVITNYLVARQRWIRGTSANQIRDLVKECQYIENPTSDDYYRFYDEDPIAARVVELFPRECWQVSPIVYETENEEEITPFEQGIHDIAKFLRGEKSWYEGDEENNLIWESCQKIDEVSGIDSYGVLMIGFDDVQDPSQLARPVRGIDLGYQEIPDKIGEDTQTSPSGVPFHDPYYGNPGPSNPDGSITQPLYPINPIVPSKNGLLNKVLYLRAFPQVMAEIGQRENNRRSNRFGFPLTYNITFNDTRDEQNTTAMMASGVYRVHWTRCIHVADNTVSSPIFGRSRLKPVLQRIQDLQKEYSATAEGVWQQAFAKYAVETHPQLGGAVKVNEQALKDMFELVRNGLQREMILRGMTMKSLAPAVTDPSNFIDKAIEAICIKLGCPIRIFKGSERGELASSQDDDAWNDRLKERQNRHITPKIIVPLFDRLIQCKALPEPKSFKVTWPDLTSRSKSEKATTAVALTNAMSAYISDSLEDLIPRMDFFTKVMGFTQSEAKEVLRNSGQDPNAMASLTDISPIEDSTKDYATDTEETIPNPNSPIPTSPTDTQPNNPSLTSPTGATV